MTAYDRTETVVRAWLADSVEPPRVPDYLPDLIALTARTSQRPAWTLSERWTPMATLTRVQTAFAPVPWRALALLALLLALMGAALVFYVGRSAPLPKPFGPAANGIVAYADRGDIFTVDPRSGVIQTLTTGPATDGDPVFSRDGAWLAFRSTEGGQASLVVLRPDGADRRVVGRISALSTFGFSPDSESLLVLTTAVGASASLAVMPLDGGPPRSLVEGMTIDYAAWLPPDGRRIVIHAERPAEGQGLYVLDAAGGPLRELVPPKEGQFLGNPVISPDGSRVAYIAWVDAATLTARIKVVSVADQTVMEPSMPDGAVWQAAFAWSNDGTKLLIARGYAGDYEDTVLAVVPVDDLSSRGVETKRGIPLMLECCIGSEWAPDDSVVLVTPVNATAGHDTQVLLDPGTGEVRPATWSTRAPPTWQRLAP